MKRKMLVLLLLFLVPIRVWADDAGQIEQDLTEILRQLDLSEWDAWFSEQGGTDAFVPSKYLKASVLGENDSTWEWEIGQKWQELLRAPLQKSLRSFLWYLGFGVVAVCVNGLRVGNGLDDSVEYVSATLAGCLSLTVAVPLVMDAKKMMETVAMGYEVVFPILLGCLTLFGMNRSGMALEPLSLTLVGGVIGCIKTVVFPLALVGGVLAALNGLGGGRNAEFSKLCYRAAKWVLGIVSSLYLALTAFKSSVAVQADGVLLKTTKIAAGSLPFVGGLVSDSVDTVYRCLLLVRSALGVTGILVLALAVLQPLLALFLQRCALKLAAACLRPIGPVGYADTLHSIGDMLGIVVLCVMAVLVMGAMTVGMVMGIRSVG